MGAHFHLAIHTFGQIENVLERHLPPVAVLQPILAKLSESILPRRTWSEPWPNLTPIQPGGAKPPFFWIHGDWSNDYLPRYLGADQPLYGFKHQSRDGGRARYTQVETIAAHYLTQLRTVQEQGPYFLGGYSFGGTLAFEMALQLQREGQRVALLFIIDSLSPGTRVGESSSFQGIPSGEQTSPRLRPDIQRHLHNISTLKLRQKLNYFFIRAEDKLQQRISAISKVFKRRLSKIYLAIGRPLPISLRRNYILEIYYNAIEKYVPQPYLGPTIYIKSEKRSNHHRSEWSNLIPEGLETYEVGNCDHMDVIKEANALFWAERLKAGLQKAQKSVIAS